jgi:hypothetical protein
MSGFAGKLQRFLADNVPWFLQGPNGGAFLEALGLTLDNGTQTLVTGLRQSNPLQAFIDNLPFIGADRSIRRYPTEPVQSYRARLQRWRQIRHFVGTHYGQMISLQPYFLPGQLPTIRIVHQSGDGSSATWHTLSPEGVYSVDREEPSNWNFDGVPSKWSRFWLIIDGSSLTRDAALYDDGTTYGDGTVWGGYMSSAARDDIVSIVNDSKAAHSILWGVIICDNADDFDPASTAVADADGRTSLPVGNWGSAIDPATGAPGRLASAHFIFDLGQG